MVRGRCSPPCHPGSSAELRNASLQIRSMSAEQCREGFLVLAGVQRLVEDPTQVPRVFARRQSTLAGRPPSRGAEASTVNPSSPRLCLFRLVVAYTDPPCVSLHRLRFRLCSARHLCSADDLRFALRFRLESPLCWKGSPWCNRLDACEMGKDGEAVRKRENKTEQKKGKQEKEHGGDTQEVKRERRRGDTKRKTYGNE